jgi:citronellol/citronellal dehydrogenase
MAYRSIFRNGLFDGTVAIVTGGGSGIGRATAHELASLGATVALVGRKPEKLARTADEIESAYARRPAEYACDIRDEDAVKSVVASVVAEHGHIDALVNNAGGQFFAPLETISLKGWEAVVRTNLTGGFLFARECFVQSMRAHGGAIVNVIADMWTSMPGMGHSGAARAGMLNFTMTAAVEWARAGVRVNAVAPGWIASSGLAEYPEMMRPMLVQLAKHVPLQRFGTESEVSAAIAFLLSPAASFISGECLRVDGAAPNARLHYPLTAHERSEAFLGFDLERPPEFLEKSPAS